MNQFPFRKDPNPDLTRTIAEIVAPQGKKTPKGEPKATDPKGGKYEAKPVAESHTRAQLEKLGVARLRELKKKYERLVLRGDKDASRELADIRGLLRSKGAGHALDEAAPTTSREWEAANRTSRETAQALQRGMKRFRKRMGTAKPSPKPSPKQVDEARKGLGKTQYGKALRKLADAAERIRANPPKPPVNPFKTPVKEEMTTCERSAMARLKAANAEDLKEKGGKAGEKAHKRLHTTIKSVVGEGQEYTAALEAALDEMAQTSARAKEMGKRIAAERDPKKKAYLKQWDAGEKVSNRTYGTKGRIIKTHRPGSHQEAVEYAEFLEGILDNLCEELGLDPQAVMEDIQTAEREQEMAPKVKKARKIEAAADAAAWREMKKAERGGASYSWKAFDKVFAKYRKKHGINAKGGPASIIARDNKERDDPTTLYGKGGKKVATRKPATGYTEWKPIKRK